MKNEVLYVNERPRFGVAILLVYREEQLVRGEAGDWSCGAAGFAQGSNGLWSRPTAIGKAIDRHFLDRTAAILQRTHE